MKRGSASLGKIMAGFFVFVLLVLLPFALRLPEPQALRIDQALFALNGAEPKPVTLPHSWARDIPVGPAEGEYRMTLTLPTEADRPQFLLIPLTRLDTQVELNGQKLDILRANAWASPLVNAANLVRVPDGAAHAGENTLSIRLQRMDGFRPGYLSSVYAGDSAHILSNYQLRAFLADQLRIIILALPAMLTIGVAGLYLIRRHDHIYGWFFLLGTGGLLVNLVDLGPFHLFPDPVRAMLAVAFTNFTSVAVFGTALATAGHPRPRWLLPLAVLCPAISFTALSFSQRFMPLGALTGFVTLIWLFAAIIVLVREFRSTRNVEHAVLAAALALLIWYGLVDIATISGIHDRGFLLLPYPQALLITAVAFILFRRLAISMNGLDTANGTLRAKLLERELELAEAHAQERALAAGMAREQERQRLMRDLHDGLSGHIVSIIALAERQEESDIEQAAREALDDLRLVIQSLDIGSEEVPVILAYFRERATPQLRRLGIGFDWSMERMPAIAGVSPSHALALLRILQEAVTNAVKHGPARRIAITGEPAGEGMAIITVDNDGRDMSIQDNGNGLRNMRQRAASLGGNLMIASRPNGMRLTLELPRKLPASGSYVDTEAGRLTAGSDRASPIRPFPPTSTSSSEGAT